MYARTFVQCIISFIINNNSFFFFLIALNNNLFLKLLFAEGPLLKWVYVVYSVSLFSGYKRLIQFLDLLK